MSLLKLLLCLGKRAWIALRTSELCLAGLTKLALSGGQTKSSQKRLICWANLPPCCQYMITETETMDIHPQRVTDTGLTLKEKKSFIPHLELISQITRIHWWPYRHKVLLKLGVRASGAKAHPELSAPRATSSLKCIFWMSGNVRQTMCESWYNLRYVLWYPDLPLTIIYAEWLSMGM